MRRFEAPAGATAARTLYTSSQMPIATPWWAIRGQLASVSNQSKPTQESEKADDMTTSDNFFKKK